MIVVETRYFFLFRFSLLQNCSCSRIRLTVATLKWLTAQLEASKTLLLLLGDDERMKDDYFRPTETFIGDVGPMGQYL